MQRLGIKLPAFAEEHTINTNNALALWMIVLGAGIQPKIIKDVQRCWEIVAAASHLEGDAIDSLIALDEKMTLISGSQQDELGMKIISKTEWIEAKNVFLTKNSFIYS